MGIICLRCILDWPSTGDGCVNIAQKLIIQVVLVLGENGLKGLIHMPFNKFLRYCCPDWQLTFNFRLKGTNNDQNDASK